LEVLSSDVIGNDNYLAKVLFSGDHTLSLHYSNETLFVYIL